MMKVEDTSEAEDDLPLTAPIKVECEFCEQHFRNTIEKNAHILQHFVREFCSKCNKVLLRIGDEVYVLHSTVTCIPDEHEIVENEPILIDSDIKTETESGYVEPTTSWASEWEDDDDNSLNSINTGHNDSTSEHTTSQLDRNVLIAHEADKIEQDTKQADVTTENTIKTKPKAVEIDVIIDRSIKKKPCPFEGCNELLSLNAFYRHVEKHRGKSFTCDVCKVTFLERHRLRDHILKNHDPAYAKKKLEKGINTNKKKNTDRNSKIYPCKVEGCFEMLSLNNRGAHTAKHRNEKFECDICKSIFTQKFRMRQHILDKHDPTSRKFKCDLCDSKFSRNSELRKHHRITHLKERNFMCNECGKTFISNSRLKIHINLHTGEKPFECKYDGCSKSFRTQTRRYEHYRVHTGKKPFNCPVEGCDKKFAYPTDIKRHKFNAHGIYTRKYPCQICSEIFPENRLLTKHMKQQHEQFEQV